MLILQNVSGLQLVVYCNSFKGHSLSFFSVSFMVFPEKSRVEINLCYQISMLYHYRELCLLFNNRERNGLKWTPVSTLKKAYSFAWTLHIVYGSGFL